MGDENPIRTLGNYSKPTHKGYRNTIELPVGNNMVPLQSDTIQLVQNECPFHGLRSEDPNQHLKDFLKLVDSLDLDGENRERTRQCLFQFSLRDQASNWLERLPVGSITTWEDLTTYPNPEQAFVEYASSRTDEARGKWYTFKPEQNNLGDTYNPSWKSHPNLSSFNNRPQNFNKESNIEGLVFEFMASQDARLSKFKADFKQQQSEMTNKIDTMLKAITDRIVGTLPSGTVKNPKLGTHPVSFARSYPTMDPQCSTQIHSSINAITIHPKQQSDSHDRTEENEEEERGNPENHPDSPTPLDPLISFVTEKVLKFNSLFESL
ncbi:hypothetical protein Tco_1440947 [Tanacetum coccineum]